MFLNTFIVAKSVEKSNFFANSIWIGITLVIFILIVLFIIMVLKKNIYKDFSKISKKELRSNLPKSIDMYDLMNSINQAEGLYKEISKECHPDLFLDSEKHDVAEELFKSISENRRNFKVLNELKTRAIQELNIKF